MRGSRYAGLYVEGGRATIRGTKVEDTVPQADARGGFDLAVGVGAEATIDDSTLTGGVQGVLAGTADTKLAMNRVVITRQAPNPASNVRPSGIAAVGGAHVTLDAVDRLRNLVADAAAAAEDDEPDRSTETIIRDIHISGSAARGYGVTATYGGHVAARSSMIADIENTAGLSRDEESTLEALLGGGRRADSDGQPHRRHGKSDGKGGGVAVTHQGQGDARRRRDPRGLGASLRSSTPGARST